MQIIECKDCCGKVSLSINNCIHCGCPKIHSLYDLAKDLSVGKKRPGWTCAFFKSGSPQSLAQIKNGTRVGYEVSFHINGQMESEGFYQKDKKKGDWLFWNNTGVLIKKINFWNNLVMNEEIFYTNGVKASQKEFDYEFTGFVNRKNLKHFRRLKNAFTWIPFGESCKENSVNNFEGSIENYFESGQPKDHASYRNGLRNGCSQTFYENGEVHSKGNYVNDLKEGIWNFWFPSGGKKRLATYRKGKEWDLQKKWHKNGHKIVEEYIYEGNPIGLSLSWYTNGNPKTRYNFDGEGRMTGEQIDWEMDGTEHRWEAEELD
jgi:antitoxin component YwqK of YwqJK toxin-antitoxin module